MFVAYANADYIRVLFAFLLLQFTTFNQNSMALELPQINISQSSLSHYIQQPTITSILVDHLGFLWIGTQQGLYRFDGAEHIIFNSDRSNDNWIPASDIREISEVNGTLLVATYGAGVLHWSESEKKFRQISNETKGHDLFLTHVLHTNNNFILTASNERLVLHTLETQGEIFLSEPLYSIQNFGAVGSLLDGGKDQILLSNSRGLFRFSLDDMTLASITGTGDFLKNGSHSTITSLFLAPNGNLFYGTEAGKVGVLKSIHQPSAIAESVINKANGSVTSILIRDNTLWIGTSSGLVYSNLELSEFGLISNDNSGLTNNHITNLFSTESLIFVGTYQGLNFLRISSIEHFNNKNSGIHNDVLAFEEDRFGKIWIGTFEGMFLNKGQGVIHTRYDADEQTPKLFDNRIVSIENVDDEIWIGYRRSGIQIIRPSSQLNAIRSIPTLPYQLEVTKILRTSDESVWVATYNRGLFQVKDSKIKPYFDGQLLPESPVTSIFETSSGVLIVATEKGIYRFDTESQTFKHVTLYSRGRVCTPLILSFNESKHGDIWIGTKDQGIFVWPTNLQTKNSTEISIIPISSRLESITVYGIQFDEFGNAWSSTQNGIVKIDPSGEILDWFGSTDGIQGNDFNYGATYKDSLGRIYFGGINGYNRIRPNYAHKIKSVPSVSINQFTIFGKDYKYVTDASSVQELVLSHSDYFVTFSFSVLDFLDPENNQYRYKLENFDPEWIENGTRNTATYTNLPAGDYVLKVQGANAAGVWNREGTSIRVKVLPPPWLTWWAYCCYGALIVLLVWMTKRVYDSYMYRKNAKRLEIEVYETREKADDDLQEQLESQDELIKSMYRHNVETLGLISEYINAQSRYSPVGADTDSAGISSEGVIALTLLERCLFFHENQLGADLHKYTDILVEELLPCANIDQESITTINQVNTALVPVHLASQVAVVVYELLKNSLEHAFDPHSHANFIQIDFDLKRDPDQSSAHYVLSISDNGKGIPQTNNTPSATGAGLGLVGDIAEKLGADLEISSGRGAHITLRIPWID